MSYTIASARSDTGVVVASDCPKDLHSRRLWIERRSTGWALLVGTMSPRPLPRGSRPIKGVRTIASGMACKIEAIDRLIDDIRSNGGCGKIADVCPGERQFEGRAR